jgi:hypothetical protein
MTLGGVKYIHSVRMAAMAENESECFRPWNAGSVFGIATATGLTFCEFRRCQNKVCFLNRAEKNGGPDEPTNQE